MPNALIRAQGAPVNPLAACSHSRHLCQNIEHLGVVIFVIAAERRIPDLCASEKIWNAGRLRTRPSGVSTQKNPRHQRTDLVGLRRSLAIQLGVCPFRNGKIAILRRENHNLRRKIENLRREQAIFETRLRRAPAILQTATANRTETNHRQSVLYKQKSNRF